jgi:hypothetical protein
MPSSGNQEEIGQIAVDIHFTNEDPGRGRPRNPIQLLQATHGPREPGARASCERGNGRKNKWLAMLPEAITRDRTGGENHC